MTAPGNDRGRPQRTDAPHSVNPTSSKSTDKLAVTRGDWDALLAGISSHEDPTFRAAEMLADAWGPALAAADRMGYERGYTYGYRAAEKEMADAWHQVASKIERELKATPTREQLAKRRGETA